MSTGYAGATQTNEDDAKSFVRAQDQLLLVAAGISLAGSVYLFMGGHTEAGIFVGLWVPSILSLGNYLQNMSRR